MTDPKEVVFQVNESLFEKLVEWQEKMEEINANQPEDADLSFAPKPEEAKKESPQTDLPG